MPLFFENGWQDRMRLIPSMVPQKGPCVFMASIV